MKLILAILTLTGFNFTFWASIGLLRFFLERVVGLFIGGNDRTERERTGARLLRKILPSRTKRAITQPRITPAQVAAVIPAHNEEISIARTIAALKKIMPAQNIFIGSDASSDRTVEIARSLGVPVLDIHPNRGKARVLVYLLNHFRIFERFKLVLLMDADMQVDKNFLNVALPYFDNPKIAALAGHAVSQLPPHKIPRWSLFFTAYRIRLWRLLVYGVRYGQTWGYMNVTTIIPGGGSLYRCAVLKKIPTLAARGLVIEDFNMTFEVHKRRLGKIAFDPRAFLMDQDPYSLRDYVKQINRWYLGWWQTVWRHGFWPSLFWFSTTAFTLEMIIYSMFTLSIPFFLLAFIANAFEPLPLFSLYASGHQVAVTFSDFLIGIFAADYLSTVLVAAIERKPILLLYGMWFFPLRYIDAFVFLRTLLVSPVTKSGGKWMSPQRR